MMLMALTILVMMSVVMAAAWAWVKRTGNGGWTDVFWTYGTGVAGVIAALWPVEGALMERQAIVAVLVAIWSLRLGTYVALRVSRSDEDVRYDTLKKDWGGWGPKAFGFLQIQGPITTLLALSIHAAAARPTAELDWRDALGFLVLIIAIAGESMADRQMKAFKADTSNKGKVADTGLWGWSRHPNYFFEWFGWLAYPVMALAADYPVGWLSLIAPALMLFVLTRLTGVPPLEAAMVKSRGEAYRAYQRRVSAFFPFPPKSAASEPSS